ncbi:MAG: hypothetical protein ACRDD0_07945, partial [Bacteroidales bacterium]
DQTGIVGVIGEKSGITTPVIPKGYKILGITVNGTAVNPSDVAGGNLVNYKVPATIGNADTNIVYNIGKEYQDTVKVLIDGKAQTIVPNQTGTVGVTGEKSGITTPVIPKGYKILGITVNGTAVNPSDVAGGNLANYKVPATIGNADTNIVYNIGKEYQDTVKVLIDGKAQTIVPNQTGTVGVTGEKSGITTPVIPKDYEISGITVNGTAVNSSSVKDGNLTNYNVPTTIGNSDTNIVYNLVKRKGNVSVEIINVTDTKNPIVVEQPKVVDTDYVGKDIKNYGYQIPNGYHLVKVTVQEPNESAPQTTTVSDLANEKVSLGTTKVVYEIAQNKGSLTVEVLTNDNQVITPEHTVDTGYQGEHIANYGIGIIPKGYHITQVTLQTVVNGTEKSETLLTNTSGEALTSDQETT